MDVELTSDRGDGTWTWRAAGARQPRGVIDASVIGAGAHVGDIIRVEAEVELDGITITAVLPQRASSPRKGVLEISGSAPPEPGSVTTSLLPRHERRSPRGPGDRPRPPRDDDGRRGGRAGERTGERRGADTRGDDRRVAGRRPPGPGGPREAGENAGGTRPTFGRPEAGAGGRGPAEPGQGGERLTGGRGGSGRPGGDRPPRGAAAGPSSAERAERARRTRPPRLAPGSAHRDALLSSLPPEQRPIAEQLALGGLPAVRRALAEERAAATAQGLPAASGDAIVALAEQLLPSVREAVWLDRAEAAERILDEISLRDLRAAVAGAVPRDEHGRELLRRLREALEGRVTRLREAWERDMTHALEEGRVLQALRLSTRPPEPNTRFPAALVNRLAEASGAAMTATTAGERWLALLEAAAGSPVGRLVKPAGVPEDAAVRRAAAQAAGRIPALAPLLGLAMPPPPRPATAQPARRSFGVPAMARRPATTRPAAVVPPAPGALEAPAAVTESPAPDAEVVPAAAEQPAVAAAAETAAPVEPEAVAPMEPEAVAPMEPEAVAPVEPEAVAPVEPEAVAPMEPEAVALVEPEAVAPMEPAAVAPVEAVAPTEHEAEAVAPVEPEAVAPVEPEAVAPVEPEAVAPVEPEAVAPVEPEAVAPVEPEAEAGEDAPDASSPAGPEPAGDTRNGNVAEQVSEEEASANSAP
jgi:hypothetical protein